MNYDIIKRLILIESGSRYNDKDLSIKLEECLDKINEEGMLVLNDFSYFHQFINDGVKSQYIDVRVHFAIIMFQIFFILVTTLLGLTNGALNLVFIAILIAVQSVFVWAFSAFKRQLLFLNKVRKWTNHLSSDIELVNFLSVESLNDFSELVPFDEKQYAKLWLKEMSTSMNHDWEDISIEILPSEKTSIPHMRVILGGIRKSVQQARDYGFADKDNEETPNTLLITLFLFSRKKEIRFFGLENEKMDIDSRVDQLNRHLELLFGKRKTLPIFFDKNSQTWISKINIIDRSSTERNNIKQCLGVFKKIVNSYVGHNAI